MREQKNLLGNTDILDIEKLISREFILEEEDEKRIHELEEQIFNKSQSLDGKNESEKKAIFINDVKIKIESVKESYIKGEINFEQTKGIIEDFINILLLRIDDGSQDDTILEKINLEIINPIRDFLYKELKNKK